MSSLDDWSEEIEKCWASQTTFIYPTGQMTIEFRTYLFEHNFGINYVKRLLKLSNKENRAIMLQTVEVFADETRRKSLNNTYNKLLKIKSEIEGWK